ncbi:MAG TPA: hypothetical protein DEQ43_23300 [Nocardioides bacterium]|nr:hypothetical protein [Nocardioides sp.]
MTTPGATAGWRPGWYPDPDDPRLIRYWDGTTWTAHTLPKPADPFPVQQSPRASGPRLPWWQSWWAVVPGLLICLPFGLVGLWRRPAVATWLRIGVTLATVVLYGAVLLSDDETTAPQDGSQTTAAKVGASDEPAEEASTSPTPEAEPAAAEPSTEAPSAPLRSVMPQIAGLTRKQAEGALVAAGLVVRDVRQVPSAEPRGTVLRQGKKVGASVRAGTAVVLVVAAPSPRVPSVVGRSEADAVNRLQGAGFEVNVTSETRTSGKNGIVLRQSPNGGERVKPGATVTIVVSKVVRPVAAAPTQNCTPGYRPCLAPASDYDCAGGTGDGPKYANGPIYVEGSDPYDLDRDGDGVACES